MNTLALLIICSYAQLDEISFSTKSKTYHKVFNESNITYTIHVENTSRFSELDDYIMMENTKGHRMTYFLKCRNE